MTWDDRAMALLQEHAVRPRQPITLDSKVWCACDDCQEARAAWATAQPPLAGYLDPRDAEDSN